MENLAVWHGKEYTEMKPGLERIREFLKDAGRPHRALKVVHIAGTNGKGSTARMIAAVLSEAGYRTGLYTSPHLVRLNERMEIDGKAISDKEFKALSQQYEGSAQRHDLSFFEFITGMAIGYFAARKVEVAVMETGLGGRFDATNVFPRPVASVITDVSYDHREILGNTIEEIAFEKAGIVKKGVPVVSGVRNLKAAQVIRRRAKSLGAPLQQAGKDFSCRSLDADWKNLSQVCEYRSRAGKRRVCLSLPGEYQCRNAGVALRTVEVLREKGLKISDAAVERALTKVSWPGRFDVRKRAETTVVLDGAHNPDGMKKFADSFRKSPWGKKKCGVIYGALSDKDYGAAIAQLAPLVKDVTLVPVRSSRGASPEKLQAVWKKYLPDSNLSTAASVEKALFRNKEKVVIVTGSLYLVGEALEALAAGNVRR